MELRMRYATTADGVRIAYAVVGEGQPLLRISTPPYSHAQLEWRQSAFFDELCRNRTVITFDPRGTGMSTRGVSDYSLEARMLDIDAVVAVAGLQAFALHGIWHAGPLAVAYAERHPQSVRRVVLDDTFPDGRAFAETPGQRALRALEDDWDAMLEHTVLTYVGLSGDDARAYAEFMRQCVTPEDARRMFRAFEEVDVTDLLPRVQAPALIVQHRGMRPLGLRPAQEMAALMPNAQLLLLEGKESDDLVTFLATLTTFLGDPPVASAASRPAGPASVQTVLFTDLVDHTPVMRRLGDQEGRRMLREYERMTREAIARHGGQAMKNTGDGFMAAFDSVTAAVECAIALQRAFDERNAAATEQLAVRVGLNAGEPIAEDGDLWGASVILAARVAAEAGPGEVLVPEPVRHLLAGKGFEFADRGSFSPKGFDDAVRLFQVRWRA
jgi:class 3 adenylate cyclase